MCDKLKGFLAAAFQAVKQRSWERSATHFVLGNEACDLDSAVSAVARGFLLRQKLGASEGDVVVPVMTIPREELPLKTDVNYWFKDNGLEPDQLVCWDDVDWEAALEHANVDIRLVDHNLLSKREADLGKAFFDRIVEVVDHHRLETEFSPNVLTHIVRDGSCSSQVFHLFDKDNIEMSGQLARLLIGPILIDTANLSDLAKTATEVDHSAVSGLEEILRKEFGSWDRLETFERLMAAKADVGSLTAEQLLRKDAKVVAINDKPMVVISGFPVAVSTYMKRPDWMEGIEKTAERNGLDTVVLMGMVVHAGGTGIDRDIAVFSRDLSVRSKIVQSLVEYDNPSLKLERVKDLSGDTIEYFHQGNPTLTRKLILPLIKDTLAQM